MAKTKKILYGICIIVWIISIGTSIYFYGKYRTLTQLLQDSSQEQTKQIIARVGRLIVLPSDEQPSIVTVADPDKLRDQLFFRNAKKDDVVLIYANAKKAILYDPADNKIVEVGPITTAPQAGSAPQSNFPQQSSGQAGSPQTEGQNASTAATTTTQNATTTKK